MSTIYLNVDGHKHPIADCDWVLRAACGCPISCMYADQTPKLILTEDQAWNEFYGPAGGRELARDRTAGYRVELMTRERSGAEVMPLMLGTECPHRC